MKSVVITGGSAGIGEATVKKFSDNGYRVFNLDKQPPSQSFSHTHYIPTDLSHLDHIHASMLSVLKESPTLDVIVSSAGQFFSGTLEDTTEFDYDRLMNVNLKAAFFLLKQALPVLKQRKKGSVILVSSDQAFVGKEHSAVYGATKGALAQLAKSTALDCAPFNVRVNAVCPGTIDTPLYRKAITDYHQKSGIPLATIESEEAMMQPLKRVGQPQEVAELIYFLGSDAASFITGALLPIDGGYTAK